VAPPALDDGRDFKEQPQGWVPEVDLLNESAFGSPSCAVQVPIIKSDVAHLLSPDYHTAVLLASKFVRLKGHYEIGTSGLVAISIKAPCDAIMNRLRKIL